ncbi:MAG: M67 family metallopeptidase [Chloroflexi bacterium]|nr:M67 family metallopeptidase [Chloroflexota bacterium]
MLRLSQKYFDEMVSHVLAENPNEACGILAAKSGEVAKLYRMTNVEHSPYRYSMDSRELYQTYREIEDNGWELLAIYHSHTHSPAFPSQTDVRLATWPEAFYIVISLTDPSRPETRAFNIIDGKITAATLEIMRRA